MEQTHHELLKHVGSKMGKLVQDVGPRYVMLGTYKGLVFEIG
jgi:hypothetical protein